MWRFNQFSSDLVAPVSCATAADLVGAYAHLTVGVVITDTTGQVTFVNPIAESVFAPLQPTLFAFRPLLSLSGVTGAAELATAIELGVASAPVRVSLPNGRTFDGSSRPLPSGGCIVTLFDVTPYIQSAALTVRAALTELATRKSSDKSLERMLTEGEQNAASEALRCIDVASSQNVRISLDPFIGAQLMWKSAFDL